MRPVIVVGDLMADVVATVSAPLAHASDTPAEIVRRPGGGGANVAARLAAAGVRTLLVARVGEDAAGQAALAELRDGGVELEIAIDAQRPTGTCIVLVAPGGERTMLPDPGANTALSADELPDDVFAQGAILHVSGYSLMRPGSRGAALTAMDRARDTGMLISVDPASAALLIDDPAFLHRARPVDLLLPNQDELAALDGDLPGVKEFVVKQGRDGAYWSDGRTTIARKAVRVDEVIDTTGAGDAYAGGFLYGLTHGFEPAAAAALGSACASETIRHIGARPAADLTTLLR